MSEHTSRLDAIAHWLQQEEDELLYTPDVGHQPGLPTRRLSAEEVARTFAVPAGHVAWIDEEISQDALDWAAEAGRRVGQCLVGRVEAVHADGTVSVRWGPS